MFDSAQPKQTRVTLWIALVFVESRVGLMKGIKWPQLYLTNLLGDSYYCPDLKRTATVISRLTRSGSKAPGTQKFLFSTQYMLVFMCVTHSPSSTL